MPEPARLDSRYLSLILDSVGQGIFTVNARGIITTFNAAASAITGYREEEAVGRPCREIFQTELCDTICPMRQSIDSREEVRGREVRILTKSGRSAPIAISAAPLQTKSGKLLGGVEVFHDLSQLHALQRKLDDKYRFEDIVSKSAEMHRIFRLLPLVAESGGTVLVTGESGTGKELIAKAIHNHGPSRAHAFVAVNCAALPENLLESELFGHKKGAFTDAKQDRPGRIKLAENGTLFLDEIAETPRVVQVKLLRFLQEHVYEPVGADESVAAKVRVIAATNRDLRAMVREGTFREDLYFRLNVMEIHLPPLRRRPEDVPLLARHFLAQYGAKSRRRVEDIDDEALALLSRYDFPGNIRELENIIERACILCPGTSIRAADLPDHVRDGAAPSAAPVESAPPRRDALKNAEREAIRAALESCGGNRTRAAALLGVHRVTLVRKIKRCGL